MTENNRNDYEFLPKELDNYKFYSITPIDPNVFEDNNSLLEIILARMYSLISNDLQNYNISQHNKLIDLIKEFKDNYEFILKIKAPECCDKTSGLYEGALEKLFKMNDTLNFKQSFSKLVEDLLSYLAEKDKIRKKSYLVIAIDDVDYNLKKSFEIVEQIRKYLLLPNVVILMAAKLDQLHQGIRLEYIKYLDTSKTNSGFDAKRIYNEAYEMAGKYLNKLIPDSRRIFLSSLDDSIMNEDRTYVIQQENDENSVLSLKAAIVGGLYKKTGIVLLTSERNLVFILNGNLRDTVSLYNLIKDMKDPSGSLSEKEKSKTKFENLVQFREYFVNGWCSSNLNSFEGRLIRRLSNYSAIYKCYVLLDMLLDFCDEVGKERMLEFIKNKGYKEYFYSLNDINYALDSILRNNYDRYKIDNISKFVYSIKMVFTLMLNQLSNMNEEIDNSTPSTLMKMIGGSYMCFENNNVDFKPKQIKINSLSADEARNLFWCYLLCLNRKLEQKDVYLYMISIKDQELILDCSNILCHCLKPEFYYRYIADLFSNEKFKSDLEAWKRDFKRLEKISMVLICNSDIIDFFREFIDGSSNLSGYDANLQLMVNYRKWLNKLRNDFEAYSNEDNSRKYAGIGKELADETDFIINIMDYVSKGFEMLKNQQAEVDQNDNQQDNL